MRKYLIPTLITLALGGGGWYGIDTWIKAREAEHQAQLAEERAELEREKERLRERQAAAEQGETEAEAPQEGEDRFPKVLTATRTLHRGTFLQPPDVEWRAWEQAIEVGLHILEGTVKISALAGVVMIHETRIDEPVTWKRFIRPGSPGFIAAVLRPGYKAFTIEVDSATTRAGIIWPGDRVDVIVTHTGQEEGPGSLVIARDVRVIAVGSHVETLSRHTIPAELSEAVFEQSAAPKGDTYTLEVAPGLAERLALARTLGRLTIAIRGLGEIIENPDSQPVTFGDVIPPPSPRSGQEPERRAVRIIRGANERTRVFELAEQPGQ